MIKMTRKPIIFYHFLLHGDVMYLPFVYLCTCVMYKYFVWRKSCYVLKKVWQFWLKSIDELSNHWFNHLFITLYLELGSSWFGWFSFHWIIKLTLVSVSRRILQFRHSRELASVKPIWCTFSLDSLLIYWILKSI